MCYIRPVVVNHGDIKVYMCPFCGIRIRLRMCWCGRQAWLLDADGPYRLRELPTGGFPMVEEPKPIRVIPMPPVKNGGTLEIVHTIPPVQEPLVIVRQPVLVNRHWSFRVLETVRATAKAAWKVLGAIAMFMYLGSWEVSEE